MTAPQAPPPPPAHPTGWWWLTRVNWLHATAATLATLAALALPTTAQQQPVHTPLFTGTAQPVAPVTTSAIAIAAIIYASLLWTAMALVLRPDHATPAFLPRTRPPRRALHDPHDAELAAADWMRYMGFRDAKAMPVGPDGGIDVTSRQAVAQVKDRANPIGSPPLRDLYGVAAAEGKTPLFFSKSGYTKAARDWADRVDLALFTYNAHGVPTPVNAAARALLP